MLNNVLLCWGWGWTFGSHGLEPLGQCALKRIVYNDDNDNHYHKKISISAIESKATRLGICL